MTTMPPIAEAAITVRASTSVLAAGGERAVSPIGNHREPSSSIRWVLSGQPDDAHVVFDVFRVEPDRWASLHPQMRPLPRSQ